MSLRVLLADESDTIKKVFQLSLQEYKPEIKSVQSGLDVVDVCISFKPDIIFADVLLQKKNGYDVCTELKQHPELKNIPVILMWSSFMELDHGQFKKSGANEQLEKPFDGDYLKDLIKQFAPQVKDKNPISSFLQYPKAKKKLQEAPVHEENSAFNRSEPPLEQHSALKEMGENTQQNLLSNLNFGASEMNNPRKKPAAPAPSAPAESWQSKDLSKFKINKDGEADNLEKFEALNLSASKKRSSPPADDKTAVADMSTMPSDLPSLEDDEIPTVYTSIPAKSAAPRGSSITLPPPAVTREERREEIRRDGSNRDESRRDDNLRRAERTTAEPTPAVSTSEVEAIVRAHTEEFLKTHIKPALSNIIERVIREELNKLLEEEVRLNKELDR